MNITNLRLLSVVGCAWLSCLVLRFIVNLAILRMGKTLLFYCKTIGYNYFLSQNIFLSSFYASQWVVFVVGFALAWRLHWLLSLFFRAVCEWCVFVRGRRRFFQGGFYHESIVDQRYHAYICRVGVCVTVTDGGWWCHQSPAWDTFFIVPVNRDVRWLSDNLTRVLVLLAR